VEKVRVGVVGLGEWGRHHVRVYHELPEAHLAGVVSPDADETRAFSRKYETPGFASHRDLIGKVDAVSIVAPTIFHFEIARDLLDAGIHVLVEKPITTRPDDARELIRLARRRNCVLMVGHIERFKPSVDALFASARDPLFIQARRVRPYQPGRAMDVGVVIDLMIHDLDIVLALSGSRVVGATGIGARVQGADEDLAIAHVRMANGCLASLIASRVSPVKAAEIEITNADGSIHLDYLREHLRIRVAGRHQDVTVERQEPLARELRHFLACARGEEAPRVSGEDGLAALEAAQTVIGALSVVLPKVKV
jgi:predicted dehydrogenase